MNFLRTYKPDKIYTVKDLFEHVQNIELHHIIPLKSKLLYDTDMSHDESYFISQEISLLNRTVYELNDKINKLTKTL